MLAGRQVKVIEYDMVAQFVFVVGRTDNNISSNVSNDVGNRIGDDLVCFKNDLAYQSETVIGIE